MQPNKNTLHSSSNYTNNSFSQPSSISTSSNSLHINANNEIQNRHQMQQVLSPPLPANMRKTPGRPRAGNVNSGNFTFKQYLSFKYNRGKN